MTGALPIGKSRAVLSEHKQHAGRGRVKRFRSSVKKQGYGATKTLVFSVAPLTQENDRGHDPEYLTH